MGESYTGIHSSPFPQVFSNATVWEILTDGYCRFSWAFRGNNELHVEMNCILKKTVLRHIHTYNMKNIWPSAIETKKLLSSIFPSRMLYKKDLPEILQYNFLLWKLITIEQLHLAEIYKYLLVIAHRYIWIIN